MKNMKKKGFTLVELLVVIAIIAILATVSVVGYTAFISKANQSNAMTELSQIKDAVNAAVLDGEESVKVTPEEGDEYYVYFTYDGTDLTAKVDDTANAGQKKAADADQVEAAMLALTEMTLGEGQSFDATVTDGKVTSVAYTYAKDATATWDVAEGKVQ